MFLFDDLEQIQYYIWQINLLFFVDNFEHLLFFLGWSLDFFYLSFYSTMPPKSVWRRRSHKL